MVVPQRREENTTTRRVLIQKSVVIINLEFRKLAHFESFHIRNKMEFIYRVHMKR